YNPSKVVPCLEVPLNSRRRSSFPSPPKKLITLNRQATPQSDWSCCWIKAFSALFKISDFLFHILLACFVVLCRVNLNRSLRQTYCVIPNPCFQGEGSQMHHDSLIISRESLNQRLISLVIRQLADASG